MTQATADQLARDVLSLARSAGVPDTFWLSDQRIARACTVLDISPEHARTLDWPAARTDPGFDVDVPTPATGPVSPLEVWTDGACSGNPGPGGWGWTTNEGAGARTGYGGEPATTNQRMELQAVIEALHCVTERPIVVVSDSKYVIDGCTSWWKGWVKRNWRNAKGEAVANRDLWEPLLRLVVDADVTLRWVKGHSGLALNEAADRLAVLGRDGARRS